ncbi:MAG: hypothetical protein OK439_06620 [Thaumarchaeota archaeon]|nr:hypothetical protein [Nitrososphaerota archaeon]
MGVIEKLATSLNRRDEVPNQELAKKIVSDNDSKAVAELAKNLRNKDSGIQSDCIKVLYEIGESRPEMISSHANEFISLLDNKNNRLAWGAMTALDAMMPKNAELIYSALPGMIRITNEGTVITRDHLVNILIKLATITKFQEKALSELIVQLKSCPTNQLPMYAERVLPVVSSQNKGLFRRTLISRLDDLVQESKRKRVEKVIKKLGLG